MPTFIKKNSVGFVIHLFFILAGIMAFPLSTPSFANGLTEPTLASMLKKVLPAIVNIRAQIKITDLAAIAKLEQERERAGVDNSQIPDKALSIASGVIVDAQKGYILTNAHVVADAETIKVFLSDGRHFSAKLIGIDKPSDIAVLQIPAKNLTNIAISNSNKLQVGDFVAAIGNPFGLNQTVTSGIISALGRNALGIESYENFIQIDASINPGNSGGALINNKGELIGINTAILAPDRGSIGIGFAIPSNIAQSVMLQLIKFGDVRRGSLGIGAQDISPELGTILNLKSRDGAVVTEVMPNSPAEKGGLLIGDIITQVNGMDIKNANDVVNAIAFLRVDSNASIQIARKDKIMQFSVGLLDPKARKAAAVALDPFFSGVALKNFTLLSPLHGSIKGVLVASVDEDSNAWQSDLHPGDVITSINQQKIESLTDLKKIIASTKGQSSLLLNVLRGPGALFLVINKDQ